MRHYPPTKPQAELCVSVFAHSKFVDVLNVSAGVCLHTHVQTHNLPFLIADLFYTRRRLGTLAFGTSQFLVYACS